MEVVSQNQQLCHCHFPRIRNFGGKNEFRWTAGSGTQALVNRWAFHLKLRVPVGHVQGERFIFRGGVS